ncbi:hypothetical protein JKP88DRAFT_227533 [Tribonema minus]|uniref:DUF7788 domain-containing protein n=1 Tax=Tribonema minus TaxID=303371 RepID=A0A835YUB8_9STRA|nr:hypothetical protein JKP88DRAFT_227533 [Tribonema minus]
MGDFLQAATTGTAASESGSDSNDMDSSSDGDLILGENGAPAVSDAGVGSPKLALFNKLVRNLPDEQLQVMLDAAIKEARESDKVADLVDLFLLTFQTRDVRGGKGERDLCYNMLLQLYSEFSATILLLLPLLPEYGSWKDIMLLTELIEPDSDDDTTAGAAANSSTEELQRALLAMLVEQLRKDTAAVAAGKPPSLAAKWAPREGRHFNKLAKTMALLMFPREAGANAKYRKLVASLNKTLDVAEIHMAGGSWAEIKPAAIPARCLKLNRRALANKILPTFGPDSNGVRRPNPKAGQPRFPDNPDRVKCAAQLEAHLAKAKEDPKAAGVHGAVLHPHDLVRTYMRESGGYMDFTPGLNEDDEVIEAQWRDLRTKLAEAGTLGKLVPLVDVSGSMSGTPMQVAIALGILLSEVTHESLRDRFLTFESTPQWHKLAPGASLREKVRSTEAANWGGSTNFEAAIELILSAAVASNLPPSAFDGLGLVVFSDMQFDAACGVSTHAWETHHERLARRFEEAGLATRWAAPYPVPHVIYWNLRGDTEGHAAAADSRGVSLLSGFSPSMLKLFLAGDMAALTDPLRTLRAILDAPRYDAVRAACARSTEGPLAAYSFTPPPAAAKGSAVANAVADKEGEDSAMADA